METSDRGYVVRRTRRLPLGTAVEREPLCLSEMHGVLREASLLPGGVLLCSLSPWFLRVISVCFGFSRGDMSSGRWPLFLPPAPRPCCPPPPPGLDEPPALALGPQGLGLAWQLCFQVTPPIPCDTASPWKATSHPATWRYSPEECRHLPDSFIPING